MPRIPDNTAISRVLPSAASPVASLDTRSVGQGAAALARAADEIRDVRTNYQLSRAEADLQLHLMQAARDLQDDPDYGTHEERYRSSAEEKLAALSGSIGDGRYRQQFMDSARVRIEQNTESIRAKARSTEVDTERRAIQDNVRAQLDLAIETGDVMGAFDTVRSQYEAAALAGYYSQQEVGNEIAKNQQEFALRYLDTLPANERLGALKEFGGMLPADTRAKIEMVAKQDAVRDEAISVVDNMIDRNLSPIDAEEEIRNIRDNDLRLGVESRYAVRSRQQRETVAAEQDTFINEWYSKIRFEGYDFDQFYEENRTTFNNLLTPSQQETLVSAAVAGSTVATDPDVLMTLYSLRQGVDLGRVEWSKLTQYYNDNRNSMSSSDVRQWAQYVGEREIPEDAKGLYTAQQELNNRTESAGIPDRMIVDLHTKMSDWYEREATRGREPSSKEVNDWIRRVLTETLFDRGFGLTGRKRTFYEVAKDVPGWDTLSPDEIKSFMETYGSDITSERRFREALESYLQYSGRK